jgi:hypothetical protein
VAADTLFAVLDNRPVSSDPNVKLMFPLIQGVMAFDTPYNGLSRSMFAYGAFSQYQNLSSMWNIGSSVGSLLTGGGAAAAASAGSAMSSSQAASAGRPGAPSWKRWQLLAARTGTYGAIIAGGVAAYINRAEIAETLSKLNRESIAQSLSKENRERVYEGVYDGIAQVPAYVSRESIGEGFAWMAGHLKFVGALMKQVQLKTRLERLANIKGVGVVDFYTSLGENGYWTGGYFVPKRTFCAIPTDTTELSIFREQPNIKAADEIAAHCSMFRPLKNPKYEEMSFAARSVIQEWLKNDPREVVDDYKPTQGQKERSMSEAQLWDDDGNVLGQKQERNSGDEEDELQLQAILSASGMPEAKDGGISDEDLKNAAALPLPAEEVSEEDMKTSWDGEGEPPKTWQSRTAGPFAPLSKISMPALPNMPSMPAMQNMGLRKTTKNPGTANNEDSTSKDEKSESIHGKEEPEKVAEDGKGSKGKVTEAVSTGDQTLQDQSEKADQDLSTTRDNET